MQTIGQGEAGQEATRDELLQIILKLRKERPGLTEETIAKHPQLLQALHAATPEEGVERLRQLGRGLGDEPFARAGRGSLAIDFPTGKSASDRLRMMIAKEPGKPPYLSVDARQAERLKTIGAEALADAVWRLTHPEPEEPPSPAETVVTALQGAISDSLDDTAPATDEPPRPTLRQRRRWLIGISIATAVALIAVISYFSLFNKPEPSAMPDPALMARYDGKDPRGVNGADSRCADPPPSEVVIGASTPPLVGPEGAVVGSVHLRRSPACPVIWARVLWRDDPEAFYHITDGWTLHVVAHRPQTNSVIDAPEPSNPVPIPYALSMMLTTQPGCVYVEAYFTKDNLKTTTATTSCVS